MLAAFAAAALGSAVLLGAIFSPKNFLAIALAGIGFFVLFPLALAGILLSAILSALGGLAPVLGDWGLILGSYVGGAYGLAGWYYIAAAIPLWIIVMFQFADDSDSESESKGTGSEMNEKGDSRAFRSGTALTDIDGLGTSGEDEDVQTNDAPEQDADVVTDEPLTSISGVGKRQAELLQDAGYSSIDELNELSESDLGTVVGRALAARIKADIGDRESDHGNEEESDGEHEWTDEESDEVDTTIEDSGTDQSVSNSELISGPGKGLEKATYKDLISVDGIGPSRAEALYEAGYDSIEKLHDARKAELANIVGDRFAARIKSDVGSPNNNDPSTDSECKPTAKTSKETGSGMEADSEAEKPVEADKDDSDDRLVSLRQSVESRVDAAMNEPFADLAVTRDQLARAHTECVSTIELAENSEDEDALKWAQSTVETIEDRLDAISDIRLLLESVRSEIPSDQGPSPSDPRNILQEAHDDLDEAINIADKAGFETVSLERERASIENALEDSTSYSPDSSVETTTAESLSDSLSTAATSESNDAGEESDGPSTQELIEELQRLDDLTDGYPLTAYLREEGDYNPHQYYQEFGSWDDALDAAGIDKEQRLIEDIRTVADIVGRPPTTSDMDEHAIHSSGVHTNHFDSWDSAIERAGVSDDSGSSDESEVSDQRQVPKGSDRSTATDSTSDGADTSLDEPSREELLNELRHLADTTRGYPLTTELAGTSPYSPQQYYDEFGSWDDALEAAGVDKEQRLVEELQRVAELVDGKPNSADMDDHGVHSSGTYSRYFGGWDAALEAAGLGETAEISTDGLDQDLEDSSQSDGNESKQTDNCEAPSKESYIDELQRLDQNADVVVTTSHVATKSDYDPVEISQAFGSWDEALEAAGIARRASLRAEIRRVADAVDREPTKIDMEKHGRCTVHLCLREFGTWRSAIDASLEEDDSPTQGSSEEVGTGGIWTDEKLETTEPTDEQSLKSDCEDKVATKSDPTKADYIEAIQRIAQSSDRVIKSTSINERSPYSVNEIVRAFGSWQGALDAAGVDNETRVLEEIRRLANELGHRPKKAELKAHGHVSPSMCADYFGTYTDAVEAAFSDRHASSTRNAAETDPRDPSSESSTISSDPQTTAFATIGAITEDGRIDRQFAVKISEISETSGEKKQESLLVEDLRGEACRLNVWRKHDVDVSWKVDHWYLLEQVRGKHWTNKRGDTNRQLSSTKDLRVTHVGTERPGESGDDTNSSTGSKTETERAADGNVESEEATSRSNSDANIEPIDQETRDGNSDDGSDDDILDEVISEFDELAGLDSE